MSASLPPQPPPPSGEQVELVCGEQRVVAVSVGASLREYTVGGAPVLDGYPADAMADAGRGQLLLPWPNRIRDGRYTVSGRELQLPLTEPERGTAIHGLTRWMPWRLVQRGVATAAFQLELPPQPGYPFQLRLDVVHRLDADGLTVAVSALNLGNTPAPFGAGAHPYLTVGTSVVDDVVLRVPAPMRLEADERGIPTGSAPVEGTEYDFRAPREVGSLELDTAFGELEHEPDGRTHVTLEGPGGRGVRLWMDAHHRYVMVFTGDTLPAERRRRGLAIEPMTCAPNAFQSGDGLRMLEPGERFVCRWGIIPQFNRND